MLNSTIELSDSNTDSYITYEVSNINIGDEIWSNETLTFQITFKYLDRIDINNNILNSYINFSFKRLYMINCKWWLSNKYNGMKWFRHCF